MNSLSQNSPSLSKRVLEEAWICLLGFYGRSFESQYGSIESEQFGLWFAGLVTNGVTDEMVAAAIRAVPAEHARKTSHPPNFADFLRLCTSSQQNDTLSEDRAFVEANAAARTWDRWSSAAVYHAAVVVVAWSLRQFPEKVTRPKFIEAYRKIIERERAGEVLAVPPLPTSVDRQLAAPEPENAAKAQARRKRMVCAIQGVARASGSIATNGDGRVEGRQIRRGRSIVAAEHHCERSKQIGTPRALLQRHERPTAADRRVAVFPPPSL